MQLAGIEVIDREVMCCLPAARHLFLIGGALHFAGIGCDRRPAQLLAHCFWSGSDMRESL